MGGNPLDTSKPKQKHKKGLWSPEEDERLRNYILQQGHGCWSSVPVNAGLQRNGKSCRLRWINYLRPGLKRGLFTSEEEETILTLHRALGNKWSQIAQHLPGRTDNEIKNYWHSYLKKKLAKSSAVEKIETPNTDITANDNYSTQHENLDSPLKSTITSFSSVVRLDHIGEIRPRCSYSDQSAVSKLQHDLSKDGSQQGMQLPRLFFAEWLDLDKSTSINVGVDHIQDGQQNINNSNCIINNFVESNYSADEVFNFVSNTSSNFHGDDQIAQAAAGLPYNVVNNKDHQGGGSTSNGGTSPPSGGDFYHEQQGISTSTSAIILEDMLQSELIHEFEDQKVGKGFGDFLSVEDINNGFYMNNNVMYI